MKKFTKYAALILALAMALCCFMTGCAPKDDGGTGSGNNSGNNGGTTTEKTLSSITLDDSKVKKDYKVGEKFDPAGLVVTAVYSDKSQEAVTDYTYSPNGELKESDKQITVTYQKKRATIAINVVDDTPPAAAPEARWISDWKEGVDPFDLGSWLLPADAPANKDFSRLVAPTAETDGSMKITGASRIGKDIMALVDENGTVLNPTHNKADGTHDVLIDREIVYSMNLKATGHFGVMLFCTTGAAWENAEEYRSVMVEFNNGEVSFRMQRPGDEVAATGKATISSTEFTRVDFVVTRRSGVFELKLFVGGYAVKLSGSSCVDGMITSGVNGYGQNIEFVALDGSTLWLNAPHTTPTPDPDPKPEPGDEIPEIEGVTARWIGSWQKDDTFFTPTSWMTNETKGDSKGTFTEDLSAPALEADGSLKVTGHSRAPSNYMAVRDADNKVLNPMHNKEDHDVLMDQPVVYSMLLKTEGHFGMMLFAGSSIGWTNTGANDYRAIFVEYNDGTFTFKAEQNIGAVIATVAAPLSAEKFTRVDFVFTRKTVGDGKKCEMKFYVDGKAQDLGGSDVFAFDLKGYGQHLQFSALDGKALYIAAPED